MNRAALFLVLPLWAGVTLLLAELRWFRVQPLSDRLRPSVRPGSVARTAGGSWSVGSLGAVLGPLVATQGERIAAALGSDDAAERLERIGAQSSVAEFRVRQVAWTVLGGLGGLGVAVLARAPLGWSLVVGGLAAAVAALVIEQQLTQAARRWQDQLLLELPIVAEQLGMLLSSGASLTGAIARIARRGSGVTSSGLAGVTRRIRQGVGEIEALREWADLADVAALHRLVGILALNREAADLGLLISAEARATRSEVHRRLIATIERRGEQVWVPVTVATLIPGVLLMAVPFLDAMRQLTGG
jgi:hypothetical protein